MKWTEYTPSLKYQHEGYPFALQSDCWAVDAAARAILKTRVEGWSVGQSRHRYRTAGGKIFVYFRTRDDAMIWKLTVAS